MPTNSMWYHLDNAANIFPAISDDRNTNVYRITCELLEQVDPALLQRALEQAMQHFSYFRVVMRRGLFWFYLEPTKLMPLAEPEKDRLCARIFYKSIKELLFRVSYYRHSINLEVFHAIADGSGAFELMREIVYNYLVLAHRDEMSAQLPPLSKTPPPANQAEDGFDRHYSPSGGRAPFKKRAFAIAGTLLPADSVSVISARMSTNAMLTLARAKGVSITGYLTALTLMAVHRELMPKRVHHKDVGITVPVDLRGFFPSMTARNFFGVVDVRYNFGELPGDFESVLAAVKEQLAEKLRPEELARAFNYSMAAQKNILARSVPLSLKNLILRQVYRKVETGTTCALSNLGRLKMPDAFSRYIGRFSCFLNPTPIHRVKLCICSYEDEFVLNFTSCIAETGVQRYILRHLAENGVEVRIATNGGERYEAL